MRMAQHLLVVLGLASMLTACATTTVDLPPVTESATGERQPGKIVWHDLLTSDPAASQRFYGELFGWEFEPVGIAAGLGSDSSYTLIRHNGRIIGGMVDAEALKQTNNISQWIILMSVEDIDAAAERVEADGGGILTPPVDLASRGRIAVVTDGQGALLALIETRDGDPTDRDPEAGDFLWNELWTSDLPSAAGFYVDALGFETEAVDTDADQASPANYRLLKKGGVPRAGIMPSPFEDVGPVWMSYLRVEDPARITARVPALGGKVIVDATARPLGGTVALITGPSGAPIALQTWSAD